ncbi:MAG: efflux RND transporter periplasmic adaptor subunit [Phycisphaerae bacterium]
MSEEPRPPARMRNALASGGFFAFLRILNVRLRFIFLMVAAGLVAAHWDGITNRYDRWRRPAHIPGALGVHEQQIEYYCPMHPRVIRDKPGSCPICGMPLVQRSKTAAKILPEGVLARIELTPLKVDMGRIGTTPVEYRQLSREIRTVGIVDYDETRRAFIAARIKGRVDKLMVNYVGQQVKKGDPLALLYSPDLLVAQEELLTAVGARQQKKGAGDMAQAAARTLVDAARRKLILWGITEEQVDAIIRRGTPETHMTIYAPISGIVTEKTVLEGRYVNEGDNIYTVADLSDVWMEAKIFEDQIGGVEVGTAVEVTSTAYPNEIFAGRITFVAYTVDPGTRTVSARVEIENPDYKLKPGMYANAIIRLPVGTVTVIAPASRQAVGERPIDTKDLTGAYLKLVTAYARDRADADALSALIRAAKTLSEHDEKTVSQPAAAIAEQAARFPDKGLKDQRTLLKSLSARVIDFLKAHPPAQELYVIHCPMAKADWLSLTGEVANPYYGSEMLTCGAVTGEIKPTVARTTDRYATGYYCPIYPDRLFDKPQHCPVDKFPTRFVKVEKVLAVPEMAVVDTGTRQVVYRESAPGVFDMVEVRLGQRAGEFYPVISGLNEGDRIATRGAFLVDAENRLNPAASAQYFGAGGGPSGGTGQ